MQVLEDAIKEALTMNHDLGFSDQVFGLGAGIFFLGYFLFEVPSNLMLAEKLMYLRPSAAVLSMHSKTVNF